jgi:hypothetical protein
VKITVKIDSKQKLTVFFALPLCVSTREQFTAAAGQKSVCGLRYRGSRVRTKNSNLIEKKGE